MSIEAQELTGSEKSELREAVKAAKNLVEGEYWNLAQLLHKVYSNTLFVEWGYTDWPAYVEGELDINIRSAQYMVGISDWFCKMDPEIQTWVQSLGWSKAKELVRRVTPDNWLEWKKKIAGKSVRQIQDMLKTAADADADKNKSDSHTEKGTRFAVTLMGTQADTVKSAMDKVKADANTDKDGNALTLICQDFLASSGSATLASRLSVLEKTFGVQIIAVKDEGKDADGNRTFSYPYGEDTLNELAPEPDVAPDSDDAESPDYDTMSAADLKDLCEERSIPHAKKDSRAILIEKLRAVDAASGEKAAVLAKSDDSDSGAASMDSGDSDPVPDEV